MSDSGVAAAGSENEPSLSELPNDTVLIDDEEATDADNEEEEDDEDEEDEEEEEEEDVDFNPFLKEAVSPEASSSLSSEEVEEGHTPAIDSLTNAAEHVVDSELVSSTSGVETADHVVVDNVAALDEGEDAICKRTRARYSLASFTLDELETFLQETDDDEDLPNVDDQEEYRKFLAAVLLGGGEGDEQLDKENENNEDEDNDADFEIELEELLDSDFDENTKKKDKEFEKVGRRPKTRQSKKKNLEPKKRVLRPLLPVLPKGAGSSFYIQDRTSFVPAVMTPPSSFSSGFTVHQIGQLHSLIYQHVQLLIQVFSLCAINNSQRHVASEVKGLISEIVHKRDQVLAWKNVPYPSNCFCPSVPTEAPNQMLLSPNTTLPSWAPFISGPVLSVLDVAPLSLVGSYMDDIDTAVQGNQRCYTEATSGDHEREPLFPLAYFPLCAQANGELASGISSSAVNGVPSSPSQVPRKSMAAAVIESTKQSVALVPRKIAKLASSFFPLFNPALFPHQPPTSAIRNRILFTDAEDELLALGILEYNTDWKAIQQRFLPCKSKHQIFVRQKNRCSSKAPENPIQAVRRMKQSPLTEQEICCIREGLKAYKNDLMMVWRFIVPHRDPSLLPRQWRTALGTQKSYKLDEEKRKKRRLYDSNKRQHKKADLVSSQNLSEKEDCEAEKSGGENNSAGGHQDNAGETYVHEAFLADWRPGASVGERNLQSGTSSREAFHECLDDHAHKEASQSQTGIMPQLLSVPNNPQNPLSPVTGIMPQLLYVPNNPQNPLSPVIGFGQFASSLTKDNRPVSHVTSSTSSSYCGYRPYRARTPRTPPSAHFVKLAPDLPPVNLPPSVHVVSQSAFKRYVRGVSPHVSAAGSGIGAATTKNAVSQLPQVGSSRTFSFITAGHDKSHSRKDSVTSLRLQDSRIFKEKCAGEGGDTDSDIQMHPLLFQAPEDGRLPYYPLNSNTSNPNSFSFLSGNQPQLHLTLLHNPNQENQVDGVRPLKKSDAIPRGIDFHPLMQRTDHVNGVTTTPCSTTPLSVSSGGKYYQVQHPDSYQTELLANTGRQATGTKRVNPDEKANELDLEIHLSSTSKKENTLRSRDVIVHNLGGDAFVPGNNINLYSDEMGGQSHADIQMEQEELSDSDEEIEENVEFEREEMADSEGEEDASACEQTSEMLNKDAASFTLKGQSAAARDDNVHINRIPSLELGFTNQGRDDASNSSWLSLDSCVPDRDESIASEALKELASLRPTRSCKKVRRSTLEVTKKQVGDMARQLSLGPLAMPPVRKPRKRVCRPNLNIGL